MKNEKNGNLNMDSGKVQENSNDSCENSRIFERGFSVIMTDLCNGEKVHFKNANFHTRLAISPFSKLSNQL
jgi:hypothetical protein